MSSPSFSWLTSFSISPPNHHHHHNPYDDDQHPILLSQSPTSYLDDDGTTTATATTPAAGPYPPPGPPRLILPQAPLILSKPRSRSFPPQDSIPHSQLEREPKSMKPTTPLRQSPNQTLYGTMVNNTENELNIPTESGMRKRKDDEDNPRFSWLKRFNQADGMASENGMIMPNDGDEGENGTNKGSRNGKGKDKVTGGSTPEGAGVPTLNSGSINSINNKKAPKNKILSLKKNIQLSYSLENKGSVARDHLANERTFLAWLRTSLSLASIGVAITQLFRLSSNVYTIPPPSVSPSPTSSPTSLLPASSLPSPLPSPLLPDDLPPILASLSASLVAQQTALATLGTWVQQEKGGYHHLGKPIGGVFIALGVALLVLGTGRYFRVQYHLVHGNNFPPSRRSVIFATVSIGVAVVAAFAAILAFR